MAQRRCLYEQPQVVHYLYEQPQFVHCLYEQPQFVHCLYEQPQFVHCLYEQPQHNGRSSWSTISGSGGHSRRSLVVDQRRPPSAVTDSIAPVRGFNSGSGVWAVGPTRCRAREQPRASFPALRRANLISDHGSCWSRQLLVTTLLVTTLLISDHGSCWSRRCWSRQLPVTTLLVTALLVSDHGSCW
jgi:hypothetical protein